MPYELKKIGNKWAVVNKNTGKKRLHDSKEKAISQMKLLYALENGYKIKSKKR